MRRGGQRVGVWFMEGEGKKGGRVEWVSGGPGVWYAEWGGDRCVSGRAGGGELVAGLTRDGDSTCAAQPRDGLMGWQVW